VKQIITVNKATDTALRNAVKAHFEPAPGTELTGTVTFTVSFDLKCGEPFDKTVPQAACPWTLLHAALHLAGFGRERLPEIVQTVQAMTDAERKEYREGMSESVKGIMEGIGATVTRTVAGMQTFPRFVVEVQD
jgi:hypothetical protein